MNSRWIGSTALTEQDDGGNAVSDKERARRRRAAALLGDLLPGTARDDLAEGWNEKRTASHDEQLLRDVPPHHGPV